MRFGEAVQRTKTCTPLMRTMRTLPLLMLSLASLGACEDHYPSNPPVSPGSYAPPSPSGRVAALFAPPSEDAGALARGTSSDVSRAMTITLCSASTEPCRSSTGDAGAEGSYRVVFGSGRAVVRSREQAKTDLYSELRDRTALGDRLDAELHAPGDAMVPAAAERASTGTAGTASGDPLSKCTFQLLDLVDDIGEMSLSVVHGARSGGCTLSVRGPALGGDGGSHCLLQAPEPPKGQRGRRGR
jgi:hypothetical protein